MTVRRRRQGRRARRGALVGALAALVLASAREAHAAEPLSAQAAFEEGRRLEDAGDYAAAAARFEASERLDPALGTTLNLAHCYERLGRLASAWRAFRRGAELAANVGEDKRARRAAERAEALRARVSTLMVSVGDDAPADETVRLDGALLERGAWGTPMPVDGGKHAVVVSGNGHRDWTIELTVAPEGEHASLTVPLVELAASAARSPDAPVAGSLLQPPPAGRRSAERGRFWTPVRIAGGVGAGVGVGVLAAGAVLGLRARSTWDERQSECVQNLCTDRGYALTTDARAAAGRATAAFVVGGALLVGGGAVLLFAPRGRTEARIGVAASPRSVAVTGVF